MANGNHDNRQFWLGFALLVLVGVFLGLKTLQAVSLVQGGKEPILARDGHRPTSDETLLTQLADRDSLLKDGGSFDRDPFRDPTVWRPQRARPDKPAVEKSVVPTLRALLYDNVNPSVQLSTGSVTSDWLRQGDSFQGWVIEEIGPTSVRISKNDENVVLSTS